MRFTDPSGDFIFTLLAAVFCPPLIPLGIAMDIGGAVNSIAHIGKINSVGDFAVAYGIGAAAGAATYYTGGAAFAAAGGTAAGGGGFLAGGVLGGAGYTAGSAVQTLGNGIYFGDAQPTAKEFAIGFGVSVLSAGVLQGINAKIHGRDFWNGSYPDISPISPKPTPTISNSSNTSVISPRQQINQATNNTYSINTYQVSGQPFDGKNINFEIPRPQISSYHSSLELKTDLYHNFPKELDQVIINQGTWSQRISDYVRYNKIGYNFEAPGLFNGVEGTYQIGINGNGIVFHKFFLPFK